MLFRSFVFGLLASASLAQNEKPCGAEPEQIHLENARSMRLEEAKLKKQGKLNLEPIVVDTVFHVVAISKKKSEGYLSVSTSAFQLSTLSIESQTDYGISFPSFRAQHPESRMENPDAEVRTQEYGIQSFKSESWIPKCHSSTSIRPWSLLID
jgi:hypothetical protein